MKVGFKGCGGIARVHLRAVRASNAQLVGVADVSENYARRFAAEECGGNVDVYPSARELIRHARPDVVHVPTPPTTNFKAVLDCLEAGCHVLVLPVSGSSTTGCSPEVSGGAAELVDPYNVESIRAGAERVLRDDRLRQSMIAKGLRRCRDFSWTKTAAATLGLFESLLNSPPKQCLCKSPWRPRAEARFPVLPSEN